MEERQGKKIGLHIADNREAIWGVTGGVMGKFKAQISAMTSKSIQRRNRGIRRNKHGKKRKREVRSLITARKKEVILEDR